MHRNCIQCVVSVFPAFNVEKITAVLCKHHKTEACVFLSAVALNNRNGGKDGHNKTGGTNTKMPEGELLLQVSYEPPKAP